MTASIRNPYSDITGGIWLEGNLHSHTTNSDGERSLQEVIDFYAELGHGFLMISDHDTFTSDTEYAGIDSRGMVLIPGNEITANGPHLLHVGAGGLIEPFADRQKIIDDINADSGFAVFNHPNWLRDFNHCPQDLLERSTGYIGLEIYNGVICRLPGSPYATDRWDMLLGNGRKLWGFSNDDSHKAAGDSGLGWNTVYTREKSAGGVVEALRSGRFYGSTGVTIKRINVDGLRIEIETENAERIVALRDFGARFATNDGVSISVEAPPDATYVRFECWGAGESFAWTQPVFIE